MITWTDFVLDDVIGPSLAIRPAQGEGSRWTQAGDGLSVMEDARSLAVDVPIQETGQEQRPARMVGSTGLDSKHAGIRTGMEAGQDSQTASIRQRGRTR